MATRCNDETWIKKVTKQRRIDVASLLNEGCSIEVIAALAYCSKRTIERDVNYIKSHPEEFRV